MIEENAGNPIANQKKAQSQNYFRTEIEQSERI
jgi:hypothetical protein